MIYSGVVFDMDGVLFDTQRVYVKAWELAAAEMRLGDISELTYSCIGRSRHNIEDFLREKLGGDFDVDRFYSLKDSFYESIIAEGGVPVKPFVRHTLDYLKNSGRKIALATSTGEKRAFANLKSAGLFEYFDVLVTGTMIKNSKPDPEIYLLACSMLNMQPESCCAVEDSYNGLHSAFAAGTAPVMIPDMLSATSEIRAICRAVFADMREFCDFLRDDDSGLLSK